MRNKQVGFLAISLFLMIFSACHDGPKPPASIDPMADDSALINYANEENKYAEAFFIQHEQLKKNLIQEFKSREPVKQEGDSLSSVTVFSPDHKSKIFLKGGNEVYIHKGEATGEDKLVYVEKDPEFKLKVYLSGSGKFFFIECLSDNSSEIYFLPANLTSQQPKLISRREIGHIYAAEHFDGLYLWILSNQKAPNRKLLVTPVVSPGQESWTTAILHNDSVYIDGFKVLAKQYLVLLQRKNLTTGLQVTEIFPTRAAKEKIDNKIVFNDPLGRIDKITYEPEEEKIVFLYSSMKTPITCYTYGIKSRKLSIRWRRQVTGYDQANYTAKLLWVPATEGNPIPVAYMYRNDKAFTDGSNPVLIYIDVNSTKPGTSPFRTDFLSLLDRGIAIVVAGKGSWGEGDQVRIQHGLSSLQQKLIKEKYTSAGLISVLDNGSQCGIISKVISENPGHYQSVILQNPSELCSWPKTEKPAVFLSRDDLGSDKESMEFLRNVAVWRQNSGQENLFIFNSVKAGDNPDKGLLNIDEWVFLLTTFGIEN